MHVLNDLCYLLEEEVGQVVKKGELSPTELDNVYKAVKTMHYIETIKAMDNYNDEYSSRGRSYAEGSYGNSYGNSYGRSNYRRYNDSNYARGYSRHSKKEMIEELEQMMGNASSEEERRSLMEAIRSLEK